jgi:subtilase family serine protease
MRNRRHALSLKATWSFVVMLPAPPVDYTMYIIAAVVVIIIIAAVAILMRPKK